MCFACYVISVPLYSWMITCISQSTDKATTVIYRDVEELIPRDIRDYYLTYSSPVPDCLCAFLYMWFLILLETILISYCFLINLHFYLEKHHLLITHFQGFYCSILSHPCLWIHQQP